MAEETKKCPYCAETIKAEAIVCKHCGRDIAQKVTLQKEVKKQGTSPVLFLVIIVIALACIILAGMYATGAKKEPSPTSTPIQSAWTACTLFVERQFDISYMDAEKFVSSQVTLLRENTYKVQVYYPKHDNIYQCELAKRTDGNWQLISLDILR